MTMYENDLEREYARFLRAEPAPAARRVGEISMQILRATARNPDAAYQSCAARIAETETQARAEPDFLAVILLALGTIFLRAARTAGGGDAPPPSSAAH